MGIDYGLACGDCLEFICLHKWSIVEYWSLPSQKVPSLSKQLIVTVNTQQLADALEGFVPPQTYIEY